MNVRQGIFEQLQATTNELPEKWIKFRQDLPHQKGELSKRNWGHPWHSICSYQGKLKPSIAHTLVDALLPESGGIMLDPFSGVGTIPFEARLKGHQAFAFDISPTAIAISRSKLESFDVDSVLNELHSLDVWIKEHKFNALSYDFSGVRFNGPLEDYFHPATFAEIISAREYFLKHGYANPAKAMILSCLLHILHGNRPYALSRRSHPITPFAPTGEAVQHSLIEKLETKLRRVLSSTVGESYKSKAYNQDAAGIWPEEIHNLDAIITSPPFFDSTRFYSANWMRLWFSGWDAKDFSTKPANFVEVKQKINFSVYEPIFAQSATRLKAGGYFALHLGKSSKCDMAKMIIDIGKRYLSVVDFFDESVLHCESHGIRDKGSVTDHQYVLFKK
ncbi:SAM-dependent methyltransferase [Pseudomonas proteolytica]|uniref:SAM-dependent methyltransferase n=1 Tax=Pseudomonas proteolytica TaxID=219574 RepID=UPI001474936E|nr:SAM-dependent methyltransferase [Pseudomonas proteolytica]NMY97454.1 SAM-dependent methyltransferase [Pseudomonas proteolytica]